MGGTQTDVSPNGMHHQLGPLSVQNLLTMAALGNGHQQPQLSGSGAAVTTNHQISAGQLTNAPPSMCKYKCVFYIVDVFRKPHSG